MLTRLKIQNFKSIGEPGVDLELKPLTLLVGPNGSGKTSILEGLALLAQSVGRELLLKGDLVAFESPLELAHRGRQEEFILLEVHDSSGAGIRLEHRVDTNEARLTALSVGTEVISSKLTLGEDGQRWMSVEIPGQAPMSRERAAFLRIDKYALRPDITLDMSKKEWQKVRESGVQILTSVTGELDGRAFFIADSRGTVSRQVSSGTYPRWVGRSGENLVPILSQINSPRYKGERQEIVRWAAEFELAGLVGASALGGGLAAYYEDPVLGNEVNLALAGYGSRQMAACIVQIFMAPKGSIVLIDEPEISLHLEGQMRLGELLAEAVRKEKQVLATTHSDVLLLALGRAVRKRLLKKDDIGVYHVTKDEKGTKVALVKLSKRGYPLGWPPSFDEVEKELAQEWAKGLSE